MTNNTPSDRNPRDVARSLRVLVTDDERDTVLTLMMLLREEGHEVRGAYTGRQALDAVREFNPDVLLLDIALPQLSGWEVARTVRKQREIEKARPLLIGISGEYKQAADKILSEIVGFDHYLVKPVASSEILALLEPLTRPQGE